MKRALVVGSPGSPGMPGGILQGVEPDTGAVAAMLERRGFAVDRCVGRAATRDGILAGYDRLIAASAEGDAAVLYYSGHGFYAMLDRPSATLRVAARPGGAGAFDREPSKTYQGIVPVDLGASTEQDFRGITAWELSIKQAQLTAKTRNVTVILDCCHSAQMSRDAAARAAVPRAIPHPLRVGFAAHLDALRARYGAAFDAVDPAGNPHAVRLVACAQTESAYESPARTGVYRGAFTVALLEVLDELGGAELSWAAIADAVRQRVLRSFVNQHPDLEGPIRRRLFSLVEDEGGGAAPVAPAGQGFRLGAGRIVGVQPGDVYGAMPLGAKAYDPARAIATLEVERVSATSAEARLRAWMAGHAALPPDSIAFPIEQQAAPRPVALAVPDAARPAIEEAFARARTLRAAAPDEPGALATLRLAGGELTIEDPEGPLFPPMRLDGELPLAVKNLANLGAAQGLRALEGEHGVYASELELEWGAVERGEPRPMPEHGGSLGLHDRFYVRLRSKAQRPLFAHVFDIGLRGKIKLLTSFSPTGVPLYHGDPDFVLGRHPDGRLAGIGLGWPAGMPRGTFPRLEQLVVIVTTERVGLQSLETTEALAVPRSAGSKLQTLLAQLQDGLARDVGDETPMEGFLVKRISFSLHPRDTSMIDHPFEIDENPLRQRGAVAPGAWLARGAALEALPQARGIAIRIADLVVEDNRALGKADIRVDALVCTRSTSEAGSRATWTQKFQRVKDGDRLPLDNGLVFHGPASDFVDICLWVSRDTEASLELSKLFTERATSAEFKEAAGALLLAAGAAALVPWVAAVGASAVLARMAYELILSVAGKSIGLYRTSFLAHEGFGAGRHPATGLYRAQDFSFSLVIDPVELSPAS